MLDQQLVLADERGRAAADHRQPLDVRAALGELPGDLGGQLSAEAVAGEPEPVGPGRRQPPHVLGREPLHEPVLRDADAGFHITYGEPDERPVRGEPGGQFPVRGHGADALVHQYLEHLAVGSGAEGDQRADRSAGAGAGVIGGVGAPQEPRQVGDRRTVQQLPQQRVELLVRRLGYLLDQPRRQLRQEQ